MYNSCEHGWHPTLLFVDSIAQNIYRVSLLTLCVHRGCMMYVYGKTLRAIVIFRVADTFYTRQG